MGFKPAKKRADRSALWVSARQADQFCAISSSKLTAFSVAGALAGLAGYLWGVQTGYINPELMGFHMSAHAIMMVILGGMGNFAGAIVGAFGFELVLHLFKDLPQIGSVQLGKHWQLWMGSFIVLLVIFAPRGLLGLAGRFSRRQGNGDV